MNAQEKNNAVEKSGSYDMRAVAAGLTMEYSFPVEF